MQIRLESCRVFKEAADKKSFSAAADALFISQSAVSQSIKQLETELGLSLFDRRKGGVELTEAGRLLYQYAASALNLINTAAKRLDSVRDLREGELKIGASDTVARELLLPALEQFNRAYPSVKLKIVNRTSLDAIAMLKSGELDIAFVNRPIDDDGLLFFDFLEVHDIFVGGREYAEHRYSFEELAELPLVLLERKSNSRRYVDSVFLSHGVKLSSEIELSSHELLLDFSRIGLGVSCVIKELSQRLLSSGELIELPLTDAIPPRQIAVTALKSISLSPAAHRFIQIALNRGI